METPPADVPTSTERIDRLAASRDLWPGGTLDYWQGRAAPLPARIFWPETAAQVAVVLGAAERAGVVVVPYGAGSGVCGGARGREGSWVLDTKRLDRIGPLNEDAWTVTVQAGVNGQHLEDWLQQRGFTLGHSPSSIWCSTVGGWAAARSAGQFSSRYGVFEDMVLSMEAVSPARGVFRVGADGDAPEHWFPLLLGSEGTLGVITEVTLRIWPVPETRWLRGYRCASVELAVEAQRRLMQEELWPSVLRLYDPVDTRIGGRTRPRSSEAGEPGWLKTWMNGLLADPGKREMLLSLPLALPGLVNRIADGFASGCLLIVGWEGPTAVVEAAVEAGRCILTELGEDLGEEPGQRWFHSRHAVSYKLAPIFEAGGFADTMEVAGRWSSLVPAYHAIRAALGRTTVVMAHMSHAYPEGGSIYFSFAGRGDREVYDETWRNALEACLESGATVTHHHGVGQLKASAARQEVGPAVAGWEALKKELDPGQVLNPGVLYAEGESRRPPAPVVIQPEDGLLEAGTTGQLRLADLEAAHVPRWPYESWPAPVRWCRSHWQVGISGVRGVLRGRAVSLGRGPRSAAGPDLRAYLIRNGSELRVTIQALEPGARWMAEGRPEHPWRTAQALLRAELRPTVLAVDDGVLRVGFAGAAAKALGAIAASLVPGGLEEVAWQQTALPSGALVPCSVDHPDVVAVTPNWAVRRADV